MPCSFKDKREGTGSEARLQGTESQLCPLLSKTLSEIISQDLGSIMCEISHLYVSI